MFNYYKIYSSALICFLSLFIAGCWQSGSLDIHKKPELSIINVLDKSDFDDCHIKGSLHIPFDAFQAQIKTLSKQNHYVIYCADYMCMASGYCAKLLKDAGFEHVWAYEGGMAEWYQKGYPYEGPATLEYLKSDNMNLADEDDELMVPVITAEQLQEKIKQFSLNVSQSK